MSKHKQIKAQHTEHSLETGRQVTQVLQANEYDTNPLPSSSELAKYKEIDATLVSTFVESGRLEQEYRHKMSYKSIELIEKDQKHFFRRDNFVTGTLLLLNLAITAATICFVIIGKPIEAFIAFASEFFLAYRTYFFVSKEEKQNKTNEEKDDE